ncbi:Cthe_2314 family HEPN domain-containing protein [Paenibacillus protaetiae]|uniref:Cthe-2314-like HEPN domain-containing protein n=1 Tax=Paenibacillus protaetiae TaxID=2509456 RepID=A0A4P6F0S7_9BACL|nr:Cthe_2314 family HEPN domain-containing protein [Paenibacillus protaetiae]QAY68213.1 hypothetical protein ET464_19375 [Paenibacillus protaetiae]
MLRFMFEEPKGQPQGLLLEAIQLMEQFADLSGERVDAGLDKEHKLRKYEIWTQGLIVSLDELEQSCYAAARFKQRIHSAAVSDMKEQEKDDYHRFLYFDKNGLIRLFALLDKLGILLNEMLELKTEQIKPHFSYFTVIRNLRERHLYPALSEKLDEVKNRTRDPINRLRKRRNTEIHFMNEEMVDDLAYSHKMPGEEAALEDIEAQLADLTQGLEMAVESLVWAYRFACDWLRQHKPSLEKRRN